MVNITDVKVRLVGNEGGKLKGVATIVIDDSVAVHDIKLIEGNDGIFMAMPSKKMPDGEYKDLVHAINSPPRECIKESVMNAYKKAVLEAQGADRIERRA